jgi:hypothetical protein
MAALCRRLVLLHFVAVPVSVAVDVGFLSAATPAPTKADADAIEIYMYRASGPTSDYSLGNVDMADIRGVLKYVHTEAIAESTLGNTARTKRKYNIDRITQYRMWIKNPGSIVNHQDNVQAVDFGAYMTYDYGQATNGDVAKNLRLFGDYVGLQIQTSNAQYKSSEPYYWFSLPGFCPNLPYVCTNGWTGDGSEGDACKSDPAIYTTICPSAEMACPSKGSRATPRNISGDPKHSCTTYAYAPHQPIMGGLCKDTDGSHPAEITLPQGDLWAEDKAGGNTACIYSYDYPGRKEVMLDPLTVMKEDCAGGKCKDWADFRLNCINPEYKKQFTFTRDGEGKINSVQVKEVTFCVEYDIHPHCEQKCDSEECLKLPVEEREFGIPFWRGRCDPIANARRAELLAQGMEITGAMVSHVTKNPPSADEWKEDICDRSEKANMYYCAAGVEAGGPYCTRDWGGVCTPCWIPGTKDGRKSDFLIDGIAWCPMKVLTDSEYLEKKEQCARSLGGTCCASQDPLDICCLYYDSCEVGGSPVKISDVSAKLSTMPVDDRTLRLVEATQDTDVLYEFAKMAIKGYNAGLDDKTIEDKKDELRASAYWQWGLNPSKEGCSADENAKISDCKHLETMKAKLEVVFPALSTKVPTWAPTYAPTKPGETSAPTEAPAATEAPTPDAGGNEGGGGGPGALIIILIIVAIAAAAGGGYYYYTQQQQQGARGGPSAQSGGAPREQGGAEMAAIR